MYLPHRNTHHARNHLAPAMQPDGPDLRKVDTSGVSHAALVSVAEFSASKTSGATRLHHECLRRVYSRKLVGHALAEHMRTSLVIDALTHAKNIRGSPMDPQHLDVQPFDATVSERWLWPLVRDNGVREYVLAA